MPWQDRIQAGAYSSPSGRRFEFDFEDVSVVLPKKTSPFDFPDADGTYIQDKGTRGRRFPMRLYFTGTDYDLVANDFLVALSERGTGKLEHPMYGIINAIPVDTITRKDNIKTAGNQAIFEIEFWENNDLIYPLSQQDGLSLARISINSNLVALATQFASALDLDTAEKTALFRNQYQTELSKTSTALVAITEADDVIRQRFQDVKDSIESSLSILLDEPEVLSQQTSQLMLLPSQVTDIKSSERISSYNQVITNVITANPTRPADVSKINQNLFLSDLLYMVNSVIYATESALNAEYEIRSEAVNAAISIMDLFYTVGAWIDDNIDTLQIIDTGGAYQQMLNAVSVAAGYLVEFSFSLKQERSIVLTRAHTFIDLIALLYGPNNIDENIDFFINSNNLTGSEILELPAGRTIKYYI
jgi:hypothetical protein